MNITDLPIDLTLYHILTNPNLSPSDVLGLCRQKGFILLCKLPKVGILLMKRYYPNTKIDMNNAWRQFRVLAGTTVITYHVDITEDSIDEILYPDPNDKKNINLPVDQLVRTDTTDFGDDRRISIEVKGVPISGKHWIGGHNHSYLPKYKIYSSQKEAIEGLWNIFSEILKEESSDDSIRAEAEYGLIDYKEPVDYPKSFKQFRDDLIEKGYILYYYYHNYDHYEYGDMSNHHTSIFSIHNPEFIN